jgi:hypothetical protein
VFGLWQRRKGGKRRLNFVSFTIKERVNFPVANHYHFDIVTYVNFMMENLALNSGKY